VRDISVIVLASSLAWLIATAPPARADDQAKPVADGVDLGRYADALVDGLPGLKKIEAFQMAWAIVRGSQLGPGEGWFHPGQTRYGWDWLSAQYDRDHDGKITPEFLGGPPEIFERLDRNHDGVLTAEDFDWSDKSPYVRQVGQVSQWFRMIDSNSNGKVTPEEWEAFFKHMAQDKGYVTPEDLHKALFPPPPRSAGKEPHGPSPALLLNGLVSGEIGSVFAGPGVGEEAPDFTLHTEDGAQKYSLSQWRGKKPVVLIFGSFT
jgi:hypothetical protein